MAFRILAVLAVVALSTSSFAATTTKKTTTTTTTTTQSASKPVAAPAAAPAAKPAAPAPTYTVSSSSKEMNVGLLLGFSMYDAGGGTKFTPGVQFSYMMMPAFTLGAEIQYPLLGDGGVAGVSASALTILVDGWYNIEAVQGLHVGAKVGVIMSSASITLLGTTVSTSSTNLAIGPAVGYDYWMSSDWTIGGEVDYLINTATGGSKAFQVFAAAKYWF